MKNKESSIILSICICVIGAILITLKMITNSNVYLVFFLISTLFGLIVDKIENKINYLLFFISWCFVAKFDLTSYSLFLVITLFYICIMLYEFFSRKIHINLISLSSLMIFFIYIMLNLIFAKEQLFITTVGFLINFIGMYLAIITIENTNIFQDYTIMYSLGLILSGFVGYLGNYMSSIQNYLYNMTRINTIMLNDTLFFRFSGLNLDPNYFSLNILMAFSCVLVIIYNNKKSNLINNTILIILTILGFITLSKMFLIIYIIILLNFLRLYIKKDINKAIKYSIFFLLIMLFFSNILYEAYIVRFFGKGDSISDITTGRFDIWILYINSIKNSIKILLFGNGFGNYVQGRASHNMYLTSLYYFGVIGTLIMFNYIFNLNYNYKRNNFLKGKVKLFSVNSGPLLVVLISGIVLDLNTMDFFPILIMLCIMANNYYLPKLCKDIL